MKKLFFFIFLIIACSHLKAQITSYPKYYYRDGTNKPFDKEFDLMIPFKQRDSIYYIYLYKHLRNKSFPKSLEKEKSPLPHIELKGNWIKNKAGDTTYYKVELRFDPLQKEYSLLKPSKIYSLIFFKGITEGSENIINALKNEYDSTRKISSGGTAYKKFENERNRQEKANRIVTYHADFSEYSSFYINKVHPLEKNLEARRDEDLNFKFECNSNYLNDTCISTLFNLFNGKSCSPVKVRCADTCNSLNLILSLYKINCYNISFFIKGLANLANLDQSDKYLKENKFELRKTNIDKSILDLYKLESLILNIKTQLNIKECKDQIYCLDTLNSCLNGLLNELNNSSKRVSEIMKLTNDLKSIKIDSRLFIDYSISDINSYVYNFQARNELIITPVFGYALYGFQTGFNGFTPYLGFQINFQGLNRDIPFNQIRKKTLFQRMCFTTAWTLTGVQEQNKRYDLFLNSSLITSLGLKFSHILMLNAGALWFKKADPSDLVSTKSIAVTPILSLSVNLEIDKLLNGFTKLIPLK
jgi:hypothetical protein